MRFSAFLKRHIAFLVHSGIALTGLVALYAVPPARGAMLLVPITKEARQSVAAQAISGGARLIAAGPWAGSLLVEGERSRLGMALLRAGILPLAARAGGCQEAIG